MLKTYDISLENPIKASFASRIAAGNILAITNVASP